MHVLVDLPANVRAGAERPGPPSVADVVSTLVTARYWSVLLHRVSTALRFAGPLASVVKQVNQVLTGADIAVDASIGEGLVLYHPNGVVIGPGAVLGSRVVLQQGVTVGGLGGPRREGAVTTRVGDRVFVGAGARIIGALEVGADTVVGANAVVTKSVPANSIATGVPATWRART